MNSSTSDSFLTSDSDFTPTGNYNLNTQSISPIAIFLILILLVMLIGFYINNISINNFEPNLENYKSEYRTEYKAEHNSKQQEKIYDNMNPTLIKKSLDLTNQKLNNSINKLSNLVNITSSETKSNNNQEIKELEKTVDDLKSEIIILQSKLLDNELHNSNEKSANKSAENPSKIQIPNINITTDRTNPNISYTNNNFQDDVVIYDPIANYDRLKLTDPLVDPRGRSSADQIPTPQVAAQLNFPTQGVLDRYHRVGLLIALDNDSDSPVYYDKTNRFDDFYGNQNNKSNNMSKTNSDYSTTNYYSSKSPKYSANNKGRYNGVQIVKKSKSDSTSNFNPYTSTSSNNNLSDSSNPYTNPNPNPYSNSNSDNIFTTSPMSISSLSLPKPLTYIETKNKEKKHHKFKKHSHKKENFEIEGFINEENYEMFDSVDDDNDENNIDYNIDMYSNPDSVPVNNNNNMNNSKNKYPYFDKYEYELNSGNDVDNSNFIDEFNSVEGFGNLNNGKHKNNKPSLNLANSENGILELIGKKITDNWYKYFTSISVGNKIIKINVHNRNRRELYDGDIVYISEVGKKYRVKIDKMDMIEYNPYFF